MDRNKAENYPDKIKRQVWKEIIRWLLFRDGYIPTDDPAEDRLFLALVDIHRAVESGCKTIDEIIDFLNIEGEGWFWEEKAAIWAEILSIGKEFSSVKECLTI